MSAILSLYPFEESQTANFELQDLHLWLRMFGVDNLTYVHNGKGMHFEHLQTYFLNFNYMAALQKGR